METEKAIMQIEQKIIPDGAQELAAGVIGWKLGGELAEEIGVSPQVGRVLGAFSGVVITAGCRVWNPIDEWKQIAEGRSDGFSIEAEIVGDLMADALKYGLVVGGAIVLAEELCNPNRK